MAKKFAFCVHSWKNYIGMASRYTRWLDWLWPVWVCGNRNRAETLKRSSASTEITVRNLIAIINSYMIIEQFQGIFFCTPTTNDNDGGSSTSNGNSSPEQLLVSIVKRSKLLQILPIRHHCLIHFMYVAVVSSQPDQGYSSSGRTKPPNIWNVNNKEIIFMAVAGILKFPMGCLTFA